MPTDKHAELRQYLPPVRETAPRKMLSVTPRTHIALSKLSEELNLPRSTVIDALIQFYLDPDAD